MRIQNKGGQKIPINEAKTPDINSSSSLKNKESEFPTIHR